MKINVKTNIIIKIILFILITLLLLSSCQNNNIIDDDPSIVESKSSESQSKNESSLVGSPSYIKVETDHAIYEIEKDYLTDEEVNQFVALCDEGIINLKDYLGKKYIKNPDKIIYYVENGDESDASFTSSLGWISLAHVKEKNDEYVHETVHSLAGSVSPVWLEEGMATYLDAKFTKWTNPPHYGEDINVLAHKYIVMENGEHIIRLSDENFTGDNRHKSYIAAASLIDFIEKEKGKDVLLKLFSDFKNVDEILGEEFIEIKNRWVLSLKNEDFNK